MIYAALLILFLTGYLFGSIPFGLIFSSLFGHGDIRKIGSGNIGATNVLRTGNKKLALLVLLLDIGKGYVAVYWSRYVMLILLVMMSGRLALNHGFSLVDIFQLASEIWSQFPGWYFAVAPLMAPLGAVIGHIAPVWLKFKGGKGVATTLGMCLGLDWRLGLGLLAIWLTTAIITRYSSLSALVAISLSPAIAYYLHPESLLWLLCCGIAVIVVGKHHTNIRRLLNGTEPKIGKT